MCSFLTKSPLLDIMLAFSIECPSLENGLRTFFSPQFETMSSFFISLRLPLLQIEGTEIPDTPLFAQQIKLTLNLSFVLGFQNGLPILHGATTNLTNIVKLNNLSNYRIDSSKLVSR